LSVSWVFATGNPLTLPTESYQIQNIANILERYSNMHLGFQDQWFWYAENFGDKNNFRTEAFHHLDIGVQFIKPHKKNKRFESIFEVSVYNVYNHKNPFIYLVQNAYNPNDDSYRRRLAKITIFPIIPSFTYSFRF